MKIRITLSGAILLAITIFACMDEDINLGPPGTGYEPLSAREARSYFEANAESLEPLSFSTDGKARSAESSIVLSPRWEDAEARSLDSSSMVELPLASNVQLVVKRNLTVGTSKASDVTGGFRKLVVRERRSGNMQMFVATVIPTGGNASYFLAHPEKFNFFGGEGFNGYAFCSSLEGEFLDVYEYVDGVRYRRKLVIAGNSGLSRSASATESESSGDGARLLMMDYPTDETGDTEEESKENGDTSGDGPCPHGYKDNNDCNICLPEVLVPGCSVCYQKSCICCAFCGDYPCSCLPPIIILPPEPDRCPYCLSFTCDGECQEYDWGGGGGGGNTPPPVTEDNVGPQGELSKKVFSEDSKLTEEQWEKVEKALENMNNDCMGGKMVGSLVEQTDKITIIYDPTMKSWGKYDRNTKQLTISDFNRTTHGDRTFEAILLHECFHSRQPASKASLNKEVEAFYVVYSYGVRNRSFVLKDEGKFKGMHKLSLSVDSKCNIIDAYFEESYNEVLDNLRNEGYEDEIEASQDRSFDTLKEFSKDC